MSTPIRILLVEDDEQIAQKIGQELRRAGFEPQWKRALSESQFIAYLRPVPELVLWHNGRAQFDVQRALGVLHAQALDVPLIFISDRDDHDVVATGIPNGVAECVRNNKLGHLGPAITRALERRLPHPEQPTPHDPRGFDQSLFRDLVDKSLAGIYIIQDGRYAYVNPKLAEIFGYTVAEVLAMNSWIEVVSDIDRDLAAEQMRRRFSGEVSSAHYVYRGRRKDGSILEAEVLGNTTQLNGRLAVIGTLIDVTERRKKEEALRERESLFRSAFEDTNMPMVLMDLGHRFVRVNAAFARMFGYSPEEMLGMTLADVTHPDHLAESLARRESLVAGEGSYFQMEKRYLHKDRRILWGLANVSLVRDMDGLPQIYVGQVQDITERKHAEERLQQAQKMEAVGRLAGGVAHDFNNLLTVISGYSELVLSKLPMGDPLRALIQEIGTAGQRAAGLTRQLLAFSRQQVLEPKVLDLNSVVGDTEKMLRRLIGEDISLTAVLDPLLGRVKADPGQVEQVLMNLAVNSRDAMPTGGQLTIETANVELDEVFARVRPEIQPGRYVLLSVSDTGHGMDEEVKRHLFEPFFTTKEQGKGTGLGLATVFGIVKQSGGCIAVYSEPQHGTTFNIYLPRIEDEAVRQAKPVVEGNTSSGRETILLVEDEPAVRALSRFGLQASGYTVLEAGNGREAIAVSDKHQGPIHLLLSDVVMPEMGGRQLAEQLKGLRPDLQVLFLSGYTADAVVRHGVLEAEVAFLQKPFSVAALTGKVREVLEEGKRDRSPAEAASER